jgi:dTDP-4-dehydrorhamnose 3,5-epimerase
VLDCAFSSMSSLVSIPSAESVSHGDVELPAGVQLQALIDHRDDRGSFTELFRDEWQLGEAPAQWNLVWSEPNVLRGVHVHVRHTDYIAVSAGQMVFALHDVRRSSSTHRLSVIFRIAESARFLIVIPPGVAHAFYSPVRSSHIYAVSKCFDNTDEHGCHWGEPELRLDWPCDAPLLSARDRLAGSYAEMIATLGL